MASKADVEAGRAFVRLFLKNDMSKQLAGALRAAGDQLKSFGTQVMGVGAGLAAAGASILTPLTLAIKSFASQGDELDKMAKRTGIAGSALAELSFAAEQSGSSLSDVEAGVRRMQRSILDLSQGTQTTKDAFGELGITLDDINGKSPDDQFQMLADRIASIEDPTRRAAVAMEIFGSGGTAILPMLGNLAELRQEARDLGIIPAQEEIENAAKVTDAINRVRRVVKAMIFDIGESMVEPTLRFLDSAKRIGVAIKTWVKSNGELIRTAALVGVVLMAAGAAVTAFGAAIFGAGVVLTALASVVSAVLSPVGLVVAAVAGAIVAFFRWTEAGQSAYTSLSSMLGKLLGRFRDVFGGIGKAIQSGKFELAFEIMKAAASLAFAEVAARAKYVFATLIPGLASATFQGMLGGFSAVVDGWRRPLFAFFDLLKTQIVVGFDFWVKYTQSQWTLFGDLSKVAIQDSLAFLINGMITVGEFIRKTFSEALIGPIGDFVEAAAKAAQTAAKNFTRAMMGLGPTGGESHIVSDAFKEAERKRNAATAASQAGGSSIIAGLAGQYASPEDAIRAHMQRIAEAGKEAASILGPAASEFDEAMRGLSGDVRDRFMERFHEAFAEVGDYKDPAAVEALRHELYGLISEASATGAIGGEAAGAMAGGGAGSAAAGGGVTGPERGVALTATYSAAAARISGYQPGGGPEEKIAGGIAAIGDNTKQMVTAIDALLAQEEKMQRTYEQFLAGWQVG